MKNIISIFLLSLVILCGCALLKPSGSLISVKPAVANQEGQADNNILKAQIESLLKLNGDLTAQLTAKGQMGVGNNMNETSTKVNGNQTISNDSAMIERVLQTYKELSERYIRLNRYIIGALFIQLASALGLLGWSLKYQMREGSKDDRFKEDMLSKELGKQVEGKRDVSQRGKA